MDLPFDDLYAEHGAAVYRFVYLRIRDRSEAEDVTADTFMAALKDYRQDAPPEFARAWLFRIANNKVIDHWRRTARRPAFQKLSSDHPSGLSVEESVERKVELEEILIRLSTLSERDQVIVAMRVGGASHADIGQSLGLTENAAGVASRRAFARLAGGADDK